MLSWITTYVGTFIIVLAAVLVAVELILRWTAARQKNSDSYLSRRWIRELQSK